MVRGVVNLPKGTGKDVRVAVFAKGDKAEEAKKAGAEIVGAEDLMEAIQAGNIDFDRVIATPDMMGVVGRLGKVLGPKGLMPNPKLGTVTMDVTKAVTDAKSGQVEFRVEKAGIIHAGIGKASFSEADLKANFNAFVDAIVKAKPSGAKGKFVKKIVGQLVDGPGRQGQYRRGRRRLSRCELSAKGRGHSRPFCYGRRRFRRVWLRNAQAAFGWPAGRTSLMLSRSSPLSVSVVRMSAGLSSSIPVSRYISCQSVGAA